MKLACKSQNVPFIRVDHLIRDVKNRAESEGHYENKGVNWHPGDRGMAALADILWKAIRPNIQKSKTPFTPQNGGNRDYAAFADFEWACSHEPAWLPQNLLLGDEKDVTDIAAAIRKVIFCKNEPV